MCGPEIVRSLSVSRSLALGGDRRGTEGDGAVHLDDDADDEAFVDFSRPSMDRRASILPAGAEPMLVVLSSSRGVIHQRFG